MYKTYIAPVLYSALAWQQMWVNKYNSNHTRTNETRRVAKRRIENGSKFSGNKKNQTILEDNEIIQVTENGVALPGNKKIPADLIENPFRNGSYGKIDPVTNKFSEYLRIDPATPIGKKGPNYSHYHLNGGKEHFSPRPGDLDPWSW